MLLSTNAFISNLLEGESANYQKCRFAYNLVYNDVMLFIHLLKLFLEWVCGIKLAMKCFRVCEGGKSYECVEGCEVRISS